MLPSPVIDWNLYGRLVIQPFVLLDISCSFPHLHCACEVLSLLPDGKVIVLDTPHSAGTVVVMTPRPKNSLTVPKRSVLRSSSRLNKSC